MNNKKHILFVAGSPPKQGVGSPIIVDRHLKRLSNNYKISIVAPEQSFKGITFHNSWQLVRIPKRRWWWLPYRSRISKLQKIRFWYWQKECEKKIFQDRPSVILTVLQGKYSVFSAYLSQIWQIPLIVILHDQEELWAKSEEEYKWIKQNWKFVLEQAAKILPVSSELANAYKIKEIDKIRNLIPIPEGASNSFVKWEEKFQSSPTIAYAGSIYPTQISLFKKIASVLLKLNGRLELVTNIKTPEIQELLNSFPNIGYHEPFEKNIDVVNYLGAKASCILVPYPLDIVSHPWSITCFPSKLVEFSHLGLPTLIIAPTETALGKWAIDHNWISYLSNINEQKLLDILVKMTEKRKWLEMAEQSQEVSKGEFNPKNIQAQFEAELTNIEL